MLKTTNITAADPDIQESILSSALCDAIDRKIITTDTTFSVLVATHYDDVVSAGIAQTIAEEYNDTERALFPDLVVTNDVKDIPLDRVFDIVVTTGELHERMLRFSIPPKLLVKDGGEYLRVSIASPRQTADNSHYNNGTPLIDNSIADKTPIYVHSIHYIPVNKDEPRQARIKLCTADDTKRIHIAVKQGFTSAIEMQRYLEADIYNRSADHALVHFDPSFFYTTAYLLGERNLITQDIRRSKDLVGVNLPVPIGKSAKYIAEAQPKKVAGLSLEERQLAMDAIYRAIEDFGTRRGDVKQIIRVRVMDAFYRNGKHITPEQFDLIYKETQAKLQ